MSLCKPGEVCSCVIPCERCKCVLECDERGRIIQKPRKKYRNTERIYDK